MNACGVKEVEERWWQVCWGCCVRKGRQQAVANRSIRARSPAWCDRCQEKCDNSRNKATPLPPPHALGMNITSLVHAGWWSSLRNALPFSFHWMFFCVFWVFAFGGCSALPCSCPTRGLLTDFHTLNCPATLTFQTVCKVCFKGNCSGLIWCMRICSLSLEFLVICSWKGRRTSNSSLWDLLMYAGWRTGETSTHPLPKALPQGGKGTQNNVHVRALKGQKIKKDQTQIKNKLAKCPLFLAFLTAFCFLGTSSSAFCFARE